MASNRQTPLLSRRIVWYGFIPAAIALLYWIFLQRIDVDGNLFRLTAIPNPIFDWWFYMQLLASDLFSGTSTLFHGLAIIVHPFLWLASLSLRVLTFSEVYFVFLVLASTFSIWSFAWLLRAVAPLSIEQARFRSIIIFLIVQVTLGLRPGAPSWYIPFFLLALLCFVKGVKQPLFFLPAVILSMVYPWFAFTILTAIGLFFVFKYVTVKRARSVLAIAVVPVAIVIWQSESLASFFSTIPFFDKISRGGIGFGHLPTVTNTIVVLALWWIAWVFATKRSEKAFPVLLLWTSVALLWFQNVLTGIAIIPDHFIYPVWILSAVSWAVWPEIMPWLGKKEKRILTAFGIFALAFWIYLTAKVFFLYPLSSVGGVMIHWGLWSFACLGLFFSTLRIRYEWPALAVGILLAGTGLVGNYHFAFQERAVVKGYLPLISWVRQNPVPRDVTWCSDWNAEQNLAPVTGIKVFPTTAALLDPVSTKELQNRYVDLAAFFHFVASSEGWRFQRQFLHSIDLRCDINQGPASLVRRFVKDPKIANFIIGCDKEWADGERERLTHEMEARWSVPLPETSNVCDRFIVRRDIQDLWRISASYPLIYSDPVLTVYGRR
ncbi:MAG: hypothetical protein WC787_03040 [Patescibacteria group bacterium]|jgi:hypothetical protein